MRLLFEKRSILSEFSKNLLQNLGFKDYLERNSMISVIKAKIEGNKTIILAIESQEKGFGVWVQNEMMQEELENFIKLWVEQEFFKKFLERKYIDH